MMFHLTKIRTITVQLSVCSLILARVDVGCVFRLSADPEAAVFRLVQSGRVFHVVDHLSPVYDLNRPLHGVQLPAALRSRHKQATHHHQDRGRLDRIILYRWTTVRPVHARQPSVAPPLQR